MQQPDEYYDENETPLLDTAESGPNHDSKPDKTRIPYYYVEPKYYYEQDLWQHFTSVRAYTLRDIFIQEFTQTFSEENLARRDGKQALKIDADEMELKNKISNLFSWKDNKYSAWRKVFNPLKWTFFALRMLRRLIDRAVLVLYPLETLETLETLGLGYSGTHNKPVTFDRIKKYARTFSDRVYKRDEDGFNVKNYNKKLGKFVKILAGILAVIRIALFFVLRAAVMLTFEPVLGLLRFIIEPTTYIGRAWMRLSEKHPVLFALLVVGVSVVATLGIAAALGAATGLLTVALPAALSFLLPVGVAIANALTATLTALGITSAGAFLVAQIGVVAIALVVTMTLMTHMVNTFSHYISKLMATIQHEGEKGLYGKDTAVLFPEKAPKGCKLVRLGPNNEDPNTPKAKDAREISNESALLSFFGVTPGKAMPTSEEHDSDYSHSSD